jgi:hypothetical protein
MYMSFQGREILGKTAVPVGAWAHLAYTYDASAQKGALYIDGALDRSVSLEPYAGPLEMIGDAPDFEHGSYALDEAVVLRSALSLSQIHALFQSGMESFRKGEYVSRWHPMPDTFRSLETVAEIPEGSHLAVTVEIGNESKRVVDSVRIELQPGQKSYALNQLAIRGATQARIRVGLTSDRWGASPLLRSAILRGNENTLKWSTLRDWTLELADSSESLGSVNNDYEQAHPED